MPAKRKTKEIKDTSRETAHEAATDAPNMPQNWLVVRLSPVQMQQLEIIAEISNRDTPEEYAKKVINQHIADRLYLVTR